MGRRSRAPAPRTPPPTAPTRRWQASMMCCRRCERQATSSSASCSLQPAIACLHATPSPARPLLTRPRACRHRLQALAWPLLYAREAAQLGVRWPSGLLLHGPPGCGKTAAVHAVAKECGAALHLVTAATIVGAYQGAAGVPSIALLAWLCMHVHTPGTQRMPPLPPCRRVGAAAAGGICGSSQRRTLRPPRRRLSGRGKPPVFGLCDCTRLALRLCLP